MATDCFVLLDKDLIFLYIGPVRRSIPPEGADISDIQSLLSHYTALQEEIRFLERILGETPSDEEAARLLRRRLLRNRTDCLRAERALLSLPSPRQRHLLMARYLEGLSWRELAYRFSLSESTLYSLHRKALAFLEEEAGEDSKEE